MKKLLLIIISTCFFSCLIQERVEVDASDDLLMVLSPVAETSNYSVIVIQIDPASYYDDFEYQDTILGNSGSFNDYKKILAGARGDDFDVNVWIDGEEVSETVYTNYSSEYKVQTIRLNSEVNLLVGDYSSVLFALVEQNRNTDALRRFNDTGVREVVVPRTDLEIQMYLAGGSLNLSSSYSGNSSSSYSYSSSSNNNYSSSSIITTTGTLYDSRDGEEYETKTFNGQKWMLEPLRYYNSSSDKCPNGFSSNCTSYGRLYTKTSAFDGDSYSSYNPSTTRALCPYGWHMPSKLEWDGVVAEYQRTYTGIYPGYYYYAESNSSQLGEALHFWLSDGEDLVGYYEPSESYLYWEPETNDQYSIICAEDI